MCKGAGAFYTPAPPLDTDRLLGRLTPEEFSAIIDRMNLAALEVAVMMPRFISPRDLYVHCGPMPRMESRRVCNAINAEYTGRGISLRLEKSGLHDGLLFITINQGLKAEGIPMTCTDGVVCT